MKNNVFFSTMIRGFLGALIGIGAGLVLGVLVWVLEMGVLRISSEQSFTGIPVGVITLPAMCIGAIFGCASGINAITKERNKKD